MQRLASAVRRHPHCLLYHWSSCTSTNLSELIKHGLSLSLVIHVHDSEPRVLSFPPSIAAFAQSSRAIMAHLPSRPMHVEHMVQMAADIMKARHEKQYQTHVIAWDEETCTMNERAAMFAAEVHTKIALEYHPRQTTAYEKDARKKLTTPSNVGTTQAMRQSNSTKNVQVRILPSPPKTMMTSLGKGKLVQATPVSKSMSVKGTDVLATPKQGKPKASSNKNNNSSSTTIGSSALSSATTRSSSPGRKPVLNTAPKAGRNNSPKKTL
jgi:hypothetical protein